MRREKTTFFMIWSGRMAFYWTVFEIRWKKASKKQILCGDFFTCECPCKGYLLVVLICAVSWRALIIFFFWFYRWNLFISVVQGIKPNAVLWRPPTFKRRITSSIWNTYIVRSRLCRHTKYMFAPYKIHININNIKIKTIFNGINSFEKQTKCTLAMLRCAFPVSIEFPTEMEPFFIYLFLPSLICFMLIMSSIPISFSSLWCRKTQNWMNDLSMRSNEYGVHGIYEATTALLSPVKPHSIKPSIVLSSIKHLISLRFLNKIPVLLCSKFEMNGSVRAKNSNLYVLWMTMRNAKWRTRLDNFNAFKASFEIDSVWL